VTFEQVPCSELVGGTTPCAGKICKYTDLGFGVSVWLCEKKANTTGTQIQPDNIWVTIPIPGGMGFQTLGIGDTKNCTVTSTCECEDKGPNAPEFGCGIERGTDVEGDFYTDAVSGGAFMLSCI
jgi:hypothetical protein